MGDAGRARWPSTRRYQLIENAENELENRHRGVRRQRDGFGDHVASRLHAPAAPVRRGTLRCPGGRRPCPARPSAPRRGQHVGDRHGRHGPGRHGGSVDGTQHLDLPSPSRLPRTSTRTAPSAPSGCGWRNIGKRAVSRSRRVAAHPGRHPRHAGEGRHEQYRVGNLGLVTVVGGDGIGEPAQLTARAARALGPHAVLPCDGKPAQRTMVLASTGRAPRCRASRHGSRRPDRAPAAAKRASRHVSPGANTAPGTTPTPRERASSSRPSN